MKSAWIITLLLAFPCYGEAEDVLRFQNGDQLHGSFSGVADGSSILWKRDDVGGMVKFKPSELRQIVLRGGRPAKSLVGHSHVGTVGGDRIPGTVRELDSKRVLLETAYAGMLEIPRDRIGLVAPNPLGGRVFYNGPFDPEEWTMLSAKHPDGIPRDVLANPDEETPLWKFSGSSWYWQNQRGGTALVRKSGMPDRAILRFDLAWKNRLSLGIAFHADFTRPELEGDEAKRNAANAMQQPSLPGVFGKSYVLHLYSHYVMLHRTTFDPEGRAIPEAVRPNDARVRLGDSGNASIELRCNRTTGEIVLFIDGEFIAQWSELAEDPGEGIDYAGAGGGLGFLVQAEDSPVRISEIVVAEWNGMPDAARSLQVEDSDIVLLTNGTDRFSGKVTSVVDGKLKLEGRYGGFEFPMEEIAEVRFAKSGLAKAGENISDDIRVRLHPIGRITGKPLAGDKGNLRILTQDAGEMNMNLDPAVMLEFEPSESFLDDWDIDF